MISSEDKGREKGLPNENEETDKEIEEYIKTVEDDVLENKYSSSFEGERERKVSDDIEEDLVEEKKKAKVNSEMEEDIVSEGDGPE